MPLLVAAAASLTDVLQAIGPQFTQGSGESVRFTFGASGTLAQQVIAGAPVDVFVSAAPLDMNTLSRANLLAKDTRRIVAANRLVLIAPRAKTGLSDWKDLTGPNVRRVAVAKTDSVPAGRYAKETLTRRKLWDAVQRRAVYGQNVRQVLAYVAGGNADAGIVFRTDAMSEKRVRTVAVATPGRDHAPIVYPASALARSTEPNLARLFVTHLVGGEAQKVFARYGFLPPSKAT